MLNNGQYAPLSIRSYPGRHASYQSYLTGVPASYSPLHGPVSGITMLSTRLRGNSQRGDATRGDSRALATSHT